MSPAQNSLRRTWDSAQQREQQQYMEYLDERDSERLPNAFNLGWKRNFDAVFGRNRWLWPVPTATTTLDGWRWEQSDEFRRQRDVLRREREIEMQRQADVEAGWGAPDPRDHSPGHPVSKADRVLGRSPGQFYDGSQSMSQPPRNSRSPDLGEEALYNSSDEEDVDGKARLLGRRSQRSAAFDPHPGTRVMASWNDIPAEMIRQKGTGRGKDS